MWARFSWREKLLLFILGALIVMAGFYFFVLQAQLEEFKRLRCEAEVLQREIDETIEMIDNWPDEAEALSSLIAERQGLQETVWTNVDTAILVDSIGQCSKVAGVETIAFRPLEPVEGSVLWYLPFELKVRGSYLTIMEYMQRVHDMPYALNITDFLLEQVNGKQDGCLEARFLIVVLSDSSANANHPIVRSSEYSWGKQDIEVGKQEEQEEQTKDNISK